MAYKLSLAPRPDVSKGDKSYTGDPVETEEMKPEWFAFDKIPFDHMWSDDAFWLPLLIEGKSFEGVFHFDKPSTPDYQAKILKHELHVI